MAIINTSSRVYECAKCLTRIPANTNGIFTRCSCGKIAIDGTYSYTKILGDKKYARIVIEKDLDEYVYKLKHVGTGLYYKPHSFRSPGNLSKVGKIYGKTPSLKWINSELGEFTIQKYKLQKHEKH